VQPDQRQHPLVIIVVVRRFIVQQNREEQNYYPNDGDQQCMRKRLQAAEPVDVSVLIEQRVAEYPPERNEQAAQVEIDVAGQAFNRDDLALLTAADEEKDRPGQPGGDEVGRHVHTAVAEEWWPG